VLISQPEKIENNINLSVTNFS
jgi:hypothetical protein